LWPLLRCKEADLLHENTKILLDGLFIAPLRFAGQTVTVQAKDRKMPKSFFGRNSAAYGPIYFKYTSQYTSSGEDMMLCLAVQIFLCLRYFVDQSNCQKVKVL